MLYNFYQRFKYQNIMTEDVVSYFNQHTGKKLTPVFNQYLRRTALPQLDLKFSRGEVSYRWKADEVGFTMPVRVGTAGSWQLIQPTTEWKSLKIGLSKNELAVDTDHYFVDVEKQ